MTYRGAADDANFLIPFVIDGGLIPQDDIFLPEFPHPTVLKYDKFWRFKFPSFFSFEPIAVARCVFCW